MLMNGQVVTLQPMPTTVPATNQQFYITQYTAIGEDNQSLLLNSQPPGTMLPATLQSAPQATAFVSASELQHQPAYTTMQCE